MSYLGAIRFVLTTDGCSVSDVSIEPAKELRIEKLLCGKRVEDALALLPPLFALCPDSQTAAAAVACDVAQNSVPSQEVLVKARFANHLELINEGVRFFARFPTCCWTASPRAGSKTFLTAPLHRAKTA